MRVCPWVSGCGCCKQPTGDGCSAPVNPPAGARSRSEENSAARQLVLYSSCSPGWDLAPLCFVCCSCLVPRVAAARGSWLLPAGRECSRSSDSPVPLALSPVPFSLACLLLFVSHTLYHLAREQLITCFGENLEHKRGRRNWGSAAVK